MNFVDIVVRKPVTMLVVFLVAAGVGIFTAGNIPIDLFPEVEFPVIAVVTTYDGAGPREIEENITRVVEGALANVSGIDTISSTSSEGNSAVILELYWDVDLPEATNEVRDQLELIRNALPEDADDPRILKFDPSALPILDVAVRGDRSPEELRALAEELVQSRLERLEGVGEAALRGGREEVVRVDLIQTRLAAFGITVREVARMIGAQSSDAGGGTIEEDSRLLYVRTTGQFRSVEDVADTVVAYTPRSTTLASGSRGSRPVVLSEIAEVYRGYEEPSRIVYVNGEPGVYLAIRKESGTNSVEVGDLVKAEIELINQTLPGDITLQVVSDDTTLVRSSLEQVTGSLLTGALFAVLVLLFFLRNIRTTFIITISIPLSLVITLLAMYFGGVTLNLLTMSGLILGLGMIVDSSIVILEHIYTNRLSGMSPREAAEVGTKEMITAITASALTTISVFLPILLFRRQLEFFGVFFGNIAFTVVVAILASLAVAILLVPVLASTYLPLRLPSQRFRRLRFLKPVDDGLGRFFSRLEDGYARALDVVLSYRGATIAAALALLIVSLSLFPRVGLIFSPPSAEDQIEVFLTLPPGTRLETTEQVMLEMETIIREEVEEIENLLLNVGSGGQFSAGGTNQGQITVTFPTIGDRSSDPRDVETVLREQSDRFPGVEFRFSQNQGRGLSGGSPIDVVIESDDYDAAVDVAYSVQRLILEEFPEITEPEVSAEAALPELQLVIDRDRAYDLGLTVTEIAAEVRANVDGTTAGFFRSAGDELPIRAALRPEDREDTPDLESIFLKSTGGELVPASSFASYVRGTGPVSIERENEQRTVHVTAGLAPGSEAAVVEPALEAALQESIPVPEGTSVRFSGEVSAIQETGTQFLLVLAVAVGLVFAVMASQFESFKAPFIIFFTIPMMGIGVMWLYFLLGEPLSMFSLVGLVMLAGIVVNNGIVLVDYTNLLRARGVEVRRACIDAGRSRLRPVLMTTFTTILGMVPLAFFPGEGASITQPVGMTIVGGLISSTAVTLFLIPVLYSLIEGRTRIHHIDPVAPETENL
ncbi:MAG: efflux RND transporter permease subunit [Spirochaetaceae bacterium]